VRDELKLAQLEMTRKGKRAGIGMQASAGAAPVSPHRQGADTATAEGTAEPDAQPAEGEGPVTEVELRQEIERTREQLGETVETGLRTYASPPTGPAGKPMQPGTPHADQAPEFLT